MKSFHGMMPSAHSSGSNAFINPCCFVPVCLCTTSLRNRVRMWSSNQKLYCGALQRNGWRQTCVIHSLKGGGKQEKELLRYGGNLFHILKWNGNQINKSTCLKCWFCKNFILYNKNKNPPQVVLQLFSKMIKIIWLQYQTFSTGAFDCFRPPFCITLCATLKVKFRTVVIQSGRTPRKKMGHW